MLAETLFCFPSSVPVRLFAISVAGSLSPGEGDDAHIGGTMQSAVFFTGFINASASHFRSDEPSQVQILD